MTTEVQTVFDAAKRLSPVEQLELIQALSQSLQRRYEQTSSFPTISPDIKRSQPVTDIASLAADFWPEDESADDINTFLAEQRAADRMRDNLRAEITTHA